MKTICDWCEQETTKPLIKFRSAKVCADCEESLATDEAELRGRLDNAQDRLNDGFYELMGDE
jgi:hypothetical protein